MVFVLDIHATTLGALTRLILLLEHGLTTIGTGLHVGDQLREFVTVITGTAGLWRRGSINTSLNGIWLKECATADTNQKMKPRIILLDIETSPTLGYVWGMWEQNVIAVEDDWFMLSFAVKELDDKPIFTCCLPDYRGYKKNKQNDKHLVKHLWNYMDNADVIIAHNGDGFDIKKSNARFIYHGLKPPSPYKTIDTLKIARKHFRFTSNKLDDLADYLKVGRKLPHQGKHTWLGCMTGDKKQWDTMRKYNAHDLRLLEGCYMHLRPWASSHVNLNNYSKAGVCPSCQSPKLERRGTHYTKTGCREQFKCQDCGAWSSGIKHERTI